MIEEITNESIKSLFKKLNERDFQILHLFRDEPTTRYQIQKRSEIPRASLYRIIDEKLFPLGFLEEIAREQFISGSLKNPMPIYALTIFKGVLASIAYDTPVPEDLKGWIRWLLQFNMDLSDVKVDAKFYMWTILFAVADHPEWFAPRLREIGEKLKKIFEEPKRITEKIFKEGFFEAYEKSKR